MTVNGARMTTNVEPRVTLLDALRNHLDVTGCKRVCDRAAAVYEAGIARLVDDWIGRGEAGDRFRIKIGNNLGRILEIAIHDDHPISRRTREARGDSSVLTEVPAQPNCVHG